MRLQVQAAFERGVRVIPVLIDGAGPLRPQELPSEPRMLAEINAAVLSDARFESDATQLSFIIQQVLGESTDAGQAAAADLARRRK